MENEAVKNEKKEISKKVKGANTDKIVIASIVVVCLLVAFGIFGIYFYNSNLKPVAKFDGGSVTVSVYSVYYQMYAQYLAYYGYDEDKIPMEVAQQAALEKVLLVEAKNAGLTLTDEDKKEIDEMFENKEQLEYFEKQGFDIGALRQVYYNNCIITNYVKKLEDEATDEEILAYIKDTYGEENPDLTEYTTRHILLLTVNSSTGASLSDEEVAAKKEKAEAILAQALNGGDFSTLAKENSEDSTATNGGLYTMYMDGNTDEAYANAVKELEVGGITTTLVKSAYGYHIIKLDSKTENGRLKNETERSAYINKKVANLTENRNLEINQTAVEKAVEAITGKKTSTSSTSENNDSTDNSITTNVEVDQ